MSILLFFVIFFILVTSIFTLAALFGAMLLSPLFFYLQGDETLDDEEVIDDVQTIYEEDRIETRG